MIYNNKEDQHLFSSYEDTEIINEDILNTKNTVEKVIIGIAVIWVLGVCIGLTLLGFLIWVAAHFISKYW
jgi:hypothetical protein